MHFITIIVIIIIIIIIIITIICPWFFSCLFVFSEEDSLVDQFVFEILVTFINSLALAHHDDKAIGKHIWQGSSPWRKSSRSQNFTGSGVYFQDQNEYEKRL